MKFIEESCFPLDLLIYSGKLYSSSPETKNYFTTGEYIRKVESISEKEFIFNGKREEMLLDEFRADFVYNLNEEGMDIQIGYQFSYELMIQTCLSNYIVGK